MSQPIPPQLHILTLLTAAAHLALSSRRPILNPNHLPNQLPNQPPPLRPSAGINGLEASAMRGSVPRGCRLLINGASLLLEEGETNDDQLLWGPPDGRGSGGSGRHRPSSWEGGGSSWGLAGGSLVCELSWMRFRALVDSLDLVCGIYVQERDASTASVQALVQLVNDNPAYLPLGFAYGHLRDRVLPYINIGGRGFAGQEVMEEFQAKQDLAREAKSMIDEGRHRNAGRHFVVACGRRLIGAGRWLLSSSSEYGWPIPTVFPPTTTCAYCIHPLLPALNSPLLAPTHAVASPPPKPTPEKQTSAPSSTSWRTTTPPAAPPTCCASSTSAAACAT